MGNKLQGNGIWESSRIILPEHREAIQQYRIQLNERPQIDEQELNYMMIAITDSYQCQEPITFRLYDPYGQKTMTGIVKRFDQTLQRIQIQSEDHEMAWVPFRDLIGVDS